MQLKKQGVHPIRSQYDHTLLYFDAPANRVRLQPVCHLCFNSRPIRQQNGEEHLSHRSLWCRQMSQYTISGWSGWHFCNSKTPGNLRYGRILHRRRTSCDYRYCPGHRNDVALYHAIADAVGMFRCDGCSHSDAKCAYLRVIAPASQKRRRTRHSSRR